MLFARYLVLFYLLFSFTYTTICFSEIRPKCHEDESHALLQFKKDFVIDRSASWNPLSYPKTTSWNATVDCCSWDGIQCDEHTDHVIHVDLSSSQLFGPMDTNNSLFRLVHLQNLDLSDNNFNYSKIPSKIGELSQIRYLNLSHAIFSGEIPPQISQLSKLLTLDLGLNAISSPKGWPINLLQLKLSSLRSIVQNSTKLEMLLLSYVTISSTLPDTLTNLTSLQALSLYNCELYGEFPVGFFHLPNLKYLDLKYNPNLIGRLPEFQSSSVNTLELDATGLYGTLPVSIGNLSSLSYLSIPRCHFLGYIPSSLGNLTHLEYLSLSYNKFKGDPFASLVSLTKLRYLHVDFNEFTIKSMSWIGKLSSIIELDISLVNISSAIPLSFANLTQLRYLEAGNSNMNGEIPSSIMNLTNLAGLFLQGNNLHGEIPKSLFRLASLENLNLHNNLLHGKLDLDMFLNLKKLTFLNLSFNKLSLFSGKSSSNATNSLIYMLSLASCNIVKIPTFIRDLGDLGCLFLSNNNITSLPSWLWRKSSLQSLTISNNSLTGEISSSICNLKSLIHLDFSFNNLSGNVPSCMGNFSRHLQILMFKKNNLSGLIPQTYLMENNIQMIDFSDNNLQGQLPRALVNCGLLEYFDISHNNINDSFPLWLGGLPELKVLALRNNKFHGDIRCSSNMTCTFPKLHIIDLSHNEFSGIFPLDMIQSLNAMKVSKKNQLQYEQWTIYILSNTKRGYWAETNTYSFALTNKGVVMVYQNIQEFYSMIAIDISSNNISGEIPIAIGDLKGLVLLNLSNNILTGNIPNSIGKLSNLEALDLSSNNLSGKIPQQLSELTFLEFFNVSFNNLSGLIPQNNQFSTFQGDSFEGNKGLCGDQLLNKCLDQAGHPFSPPSSSSDDNNDPESLFESDWKIVLIGYVGGLVAGVALGNTYYHQLLGWLKRIL